MIAQILLLAVFPALLAVAAGWDVASFTIPNRVQLAIVAAFVGFALAAGMPAGDFGWHLLSAAIALAVSFALFALGYIGGGDAKLFAAVALWLGFADLGTFAVAASLFGGLLTLTVLTLR